MPFSTWLALSSAASSPVSARTFGGSDLGDVVAQLALGDTRLGGHPDRW